MVAQLVEALRYEPEDRGLDSRCCHWNFSFTWFFRPHYGPGVDSASNRKEYQEYFLGVKVAGAYGWESYHLHVPTVLISGSLNLREPSGLVHGIALPFTLQPISVSSCYHFFLSCSVSLVRSCLLPSFLLSFSSWMLKVFPYMDFASLRLTSLCDTPNLYPFRMSVC